jgi:hypothetical protein
VIRLASGSSSVTPPLSVHPPTTGSLCIVRPCGGRIVGWRRCGRRSHPSPNRSSPCRKRLPCQDSLPLCQMGSASGAHASPSIWRRTRGRGRLETYSSAGTRRKGASNEFIKIVCCRAAWGNRNDRWDVRLTAPAFGLARRRSLIAASDSSPHPVSRPPQRRASPDQHRRSRCSRKNRGPGSERGRHRRRSRAAMSAADAPARSRDVQSGRRGVTRRSASGEPGSDHEAEMRRLPKYSRRLPGTPAGRLTPDG